MRVLVFGNINAGKTHVTNALRLLLPDRPVLSIDDYRQRYGDGTFEGDETAQTRFVSDVVEQGDCIAECSGLGPLGTRLQAAIPPKESIILHVAASEAVCLDRIENKDFRATPYPPFEEPLEDTVRRCHLEFARGDLKQLWHDSVLWTFEVNGESHSIPKDVAELPFAQLTALAAVIRAAKSLKKTKALVWFGSGPRGELTHNSDIDLFLVGPVAAAEALDPLTARVPQAIFSDRIRHKLTFRFTGDILVEITCVGSLSDLDTFYREAMIQDPSAAVLVGGQPVLRHLESLGTHERYLRTLATELMAECFYFVLSLPPLIRKGDAYKYYFHNNIILHDIIRLKALEAGQVAFNYLPHDAWQLLSDEEMQTLPYHMDDDMQAHWKGLLRYIRRLVANLDVEIDNRKRYIAYLSQFVED